MKWKFKNKLSYRKQNKRLKESYKSNWINYKKKKKRSNFIKNN